MRAPSPLWQGILWVERFLPTPPTPPAGSSVVAKRRAVLATQLVLLTVAFSNGARHRREVGGIVRDNHVMLEHLALLLAGCIAVAAIGFGLKAWRDAMKSR